VATHSGKTQNANNMIAGVNHEIIEVWKQFKHLQNGRLPMLYPTDINYQRSILFIGFNPSFVIKDIKKCSGRSEEEINRIFKWPNEDQDKNSENAKSFYKECQFPAEEKKRAQYFLPMFGLAKELNKPEDDWAHIDLFFVRETKQKDITRVLLEKDSNTNNKHVLTDFADAQMKLSCRLIEYCDPKVILVCNALASKIFKLQSHTFGMTIKSDSFERDGYDILCFNNSKREIPVLFSGMLSGGHLDIESRRRLRWSMARALADKQ
jgi:hypothetical protein